MYKITALLSDTGIACKHPQAIDSIVVQNGNALGYSTGLSWSCGSRERILLCRAVGC